MDYVFIKPECFINIMTTAVEAYNRETNGFLLGREMLKKVAGRRRKTMVLSMASPYQFEERKPSYVAHKNMKAFSRLMQSLSAVNKEFVGGYHSHPFPHENTRLSMSDREFIKEEVKHINRYGHFVLKKWLEIIISIKKRSYLTRHKKGRRFNQLTGKRMGLLLTTGPYESFNIKMAAYWVEKKDGTSIVRQTKLIVPRSRIRARKIAEK